jgi:octaprenyl-diphosphate synthase
VVEFVNEMGGIEFASKKMMEFRNNALQILDGFTASTARDSMKQLVEFTVSRKK